MIQVGKTLEYYIEIGGTKHTLTPEEAERLYDQLQMILGKKQITIYPTEIVPKTLPDTIKPIYPRPKPPWEDWVPRYPEEDFWRRKFPDPYDDGRPYVID